ncbi:MAG: MFS transporter [Ktedonobacteraceae bacterium]
MIALRERNFRLYWLGQAVSNVGNWVQIVALGWYILQINASPLSLGLLGLTQSLPIFAFSLFGGLLADRIPRVKLLIVTQSAAMLLAVFLVLLTLQSKPPLWSLLLVATLAASVTAIDNPARQAFLSDLVSKDMLLNAIALNASVYNGAAVIGPTLAGLLLLSIGALGCFLLNAISFLAVLVALIMIARAKVPNTALEEVLVGIPRPGILQYQHLPFLSPFREFSLLRHHSSIIAVLAIAAATSLFGRPYLLLMPAFAHIVQHVGPSGLGFMVASSGLGSLIGSLLLASLKTSRRLKALLIVCGVSFSLALVIFAFMHSFIEALLILVLCGAGATLTMTIANTFLQIYAPPAMRGRVLSLYTLIAAGLTPLGAFLISSLGTQSGLAGATIIAGIVLGTSVIVGAQ